VGVVVEADLDEFEVAEDTDLLKEDADVVVADVHLVTEDVKVVVLVGTEFVGEIRLVEVVIIVVAWS
jgi:hypothetical protein